MKKSATEMRHLHGQRLVVVFCGASVCLMLLLASCVRRPYDAKQDEEIYGTWTSKTASYHKVVIYSNGTWENYVYETDQTPVHKGTFQIVEKWRDANGIVWYKQLVQTTSGTAAGVKSQTLDRIEATGDVWESDFNLYFDKIDPNSFPTTINPKSYFYTKYQRKSK